VDSALAGGLFGILGVVVGILAATYRDVYTDQRNLRDQRVARLRSAFAPLLHYALTIGRVIHEKRFAMNFETQADRDQRLSKMLRDAAEGVDAARVALMLEPTIEARRALECLDAVQGAFNEYLIMLGSQVRPEKPCNLPSRRLSGRSRIGPLLAGVEAHKVRLDAAFRVGGSASARPADECRGG
jgi:hypothetical protein